MKFSTVLTTLMLTTLLTACGGGGGSGHGNIPHTTLQNVIKSNAEVTSMSNERFSNATKAREIVEDANNQISTSQISTFNLRTLNTTPSLSEDAVIKEFENMKNL